MGADYVEVFGRPSKPVSAYLYAVLMVVLSTLYALAKACQDTPKSFKRFIMALSFCPSLRFPRIFCSLSTALSEGVPKNKCSGFVHSGLSHLWQTYSPCGISPKCSIQDTRLAGAFSCMPPSRIIPYPNWCFAPIHFQQPSSFTTFSQKRSASGLDFLMVVQ